MTRVDIISVAHFDNRKHHLYNDKLKIDSANAIHWVG